MVQAINGTLSVRSEVGKGTVFTIAVPMLYVEGEQLAHPQIARSVSPPEIAPVATPLTAPPKPSSSLEPSFSPPPPSVSDVNGLDIMLVSANAENLHRLKKLAISWKANPILIGSGEQGIKYLEMCARQGKALPTILIDYQMFNSAQRQATRENWYDFCAHIRSIPSLVSVPIIVVSTTKDEATKKAFVALGMTQYLSSPIQLRDLFEAINNTLVSGLQASLSQEKAPNAVKEDMPNLGETYASQNPRCKILVADDNEVNIMLMQAFIDQEKYDIVCVTDGKQAFEAYQNGNFDLVLMDISMPVMNGLQATESIRKMEALDHRRPIPIVAVTAHAYASDKKKFTEAGMDDYLIKPVNGKGVASMIEKWTANSSDKCKRAPVKQAVGM